MPIFDYYCPSCKSKKEKLVKKHTDIQFCEVCQSEMQKLPSTPTFILKGAGFANNGTYAKAKDGPKLDQELLRLPDKELNRECGLPEDCE